MGLLFRIMNKIMQKIAQKYFKKLTETWERIFNQNICLEKVDELTKHTENFYENLLNDSLEKEECIRKEIDELKNEGENLKGLLKVDFELETQSADKPLLVVHSELNDSLEELRRCLYQQIYELLLEQQSVCDELGEIPQPLLIDPLPTAEEIEEFRQRLQRLKEERAVRLHDLSILRREIKNYLQVLEVQVTTEEEDRLLNDEDIKLNKDTFARLQHMHEIYCYGNQIRQEIVSWWDKTLKAELHRNRFLNSKSNCCTEDLELELKDLKLYYENNRKIFELFAEWKTLWERMNALEAKSSEPGRYYNRGGELLKEEKERKFVSSKLPKIEQQITEMVKQYEERERTQFLVYGQSILDVMANDWAKKRQDKENLSSGRRRSLTPISKAQLPIRVPMTLRNVTARYMSLHKTPRTAGVTVNHQSVSTTKKRELNSTDKTTDITKRSLMFTVTSPNLLMPPSTAVRTPRRSPLKSPRILSSSRRRSGRRSGNTAKKRRSTKITKTTSNNAVAVLPVQANMEKIDPQNTFDSSVDPASRSSTKSYSFNTPSKQLLTLSSVENFCPPINEHHTPKTQRHHSPCRTIIKSVSSRKLTTKNLPIII